MTVRAAASVLAVAVVLGGCGSDRENLSDRATGIFDECLQRNGVTAANLQVTVSDDGIVEEITAQIVQQGQVDYDPAIRLACTQEVEVRLAQD